MSKKTFVLFLLVVLNFQFLSPFQSGMNCFAQWVQQNSGTPRHLLGVSFANSNTGIAVGLLGGVILRTTNAGANWNQQQTGDTTWLIAVNMIDEFTACAVGFYSKILRTTNGGINWVRQTSPLPVYVVLRSVSFVNLNTGYAAGDASRIIKTTDAGANWILLPNVPYTDAGLHSIYFPNADTGFAVGLSFSYPWRYTIFRTTNGGANWESRGPTNPLELWLYGVHFINTTTGMVTGDAVTLKTTDCGISWTMQWTGGSQKAIVLVNANIAYSAGVGGRILCTSNGGTNWIQQSSGTNLTLRGVAFPDALNGTIVGDSGRILHTTNGGVSQIKPIRNEIPEKAFFIPELSKSVQFCGKTGVVGLVIVDLLGKEIALLGNEVLKPGVYEYSWNAGPHASGIYFYRLRTGNFTETKKLIILK